ncbi:uncharacterized protein LOC110997466 [Pieris rapae]|uniref:uncharacterized protein LOC110997466 n=1 Tax=Pieris rapae TaxID=64459 RepID=UPI000B92AB15|nr:uncharacterized protein LOC110997466 [Pieris rapae]XP_022121325.1 uncharacterized protein LOC110997466 [Pieris rapae]
MIYKWWHSFIRKRTKPIPEDYAVLWKKRLSLLYGFLAWNAFGLVVYSIYQGKSDWAHYYGLKSDEDKNMSPGHSWANTLGIKNAKVIRISGLSKVDEYDIVDGKEVRSNKSNN